MIAIRDGGLCCGCGPVACTTCTPCPTVAAWQLTGSLLPTGCFNPSGFDRTVEITNPYDGLIYGFGLVHQLQQLTASTSSQDFLGGYYPVYSNSGMLPGALLTATFLRDWKLTITTTPIYRIVDDVQTPLVGATAGVITKTGDYPANPGVDTEPGNCGPWNVGDLQQIIRSFIVPKGQTVPITVSITPPNPAHLQIDTHPGLPYWNSPLPFGDVLAASPCEYSITSGDVSISVRTAVTISEASGPAETVTHIFRDGAWTAAGFTSTPFPWSGGSYPNGEAPFGYDLIVPGLVPPPPPTVSVTNYSEIEYNPPIYSGYAFAEIVGGQVRIVAEYFDSTIGTYETKEFFRPIEDGAHPLAFTTGGGTNVTIYYSVDAPSAQDFIYSQRVNAELVYPGAPSNYFMGVGCARLISGQPFAGCFRKYTKRAIQLHWGINTFIAFQDPNYDFQELNPPGQVSPYSGGITTNEGGAWYSIHHTCAGDYSSVTSVVTFTDPPDTEDFTNEWMNSSPYTVTQSVGSRRTWGGTVPHPGGEPGQFADRWAKRTRKSDGQITYTGWVFAWKVSIFTTEDYFPSNTSEGFELVGRIRIERAWGDGWPTNWDATHLYISNEVLTGAEGVPGQHTLASLLGTYQTGNTPSTSVTIS